MTGSRDTCAICGTVQLAEVFTPRYVLRTPGFRAHNNPTVGGTGQVSDIEPYNYCHNCGAVSRVEPESRSIDDTPVNRETRTREDLLKNFEIHREERKSARFADRYAWIKKHVDFETVLDVGCQYGFLLSDFENMGYKATGIDPYKPIVDLGREILGVDIVDGFYDAESFEPASFDLISAECVAYYFRPSIGTFVDYARKHLRPGGHLYMQVPDIHKTGCNFMPNFVRCLIPYENVESFFAHKGFRVVAKMRETFPPGSYGVIAQQDTTLSPPAPVLGYEDVRRCLVLVDYNLYGHVKAEAPGLVKSGLRLLDWMQPGGAVPGFFARIANRLAAYRRRQNRTNADLK